MALTWYRHFQRNHVLLYFHFSHVVRINTLQTYFVLFFRTALHLLTLEFNLNRSYMLLYERYQSFCVSVVHGIQTRPEYWCPCALYQISISYELSDFRSCILSYGQINSSISTQTNWQKMSRIKLSQFTAVPL